MENEKQRQSAAPDTAPVEEERVAGAATEDAAQPEDSLETGAEAPASQEEALAEELATVKEQLMRLAAEFDNYKKRMKNEQDKLVKYAGENILRDMLPTVDNLERALEQGKKEDQLRGLMEGVELTHKSLLAALKRYGVEPVECLGQPFNPEEQDALSMTADSEVPANHVLTEYAKGYRFKDRMLRHAQVVVSSGPAT